MDFLRGDSSRRRGGGDGESVGHVRIVCCKIEAG